jgi:drug/metabolite transporter (DMT)-like permease
MSDDYHEFELAGTSQRRCASLAFRAGKSVARLRHDESPVRPADSNSSQLLGIAAVSVTVLLWGMSGVAIKATSVTGIVTAFYRTWFAIPLLWMTMMSPQLRSGLDRNWLRASILGGTLFCVHQILYFTSLKLTTVANVTIIGALQPVLVLLLAGRMFGEAVTAASVVWSIVAFAGTAMVVLGSSAAPTWSLLGDTLATVNLFAFTAYFLVSKRIRATVGAWEYVVGMTTVSGIGMALAAAATAQDLGSPSGTDWVLLAAIAIFPGSLGHALTNWAHAHVTAFVASMILLAVPVIATAGAHLFLAEPVSGQQILGAAVVLAAVGMIVASARRASVRLELAESGAETDAP